MPPLALAPRHVDLRGGRPPRPPRSRAGVVRRAAPCVDLRTPPIAIWPGEVVVVASPRRDDIERLIAGVRERPVASLRVAEPSYRYDARLVGPALAEAAGRGAAVIAGVVLPPGAAGRRAIAAIRLTVGRRAPCRCLWLVGGRVYPE